MTMQLSELKNELARFGAENDARNRARRRMLNITPDTGEFLSVLVRFGNAGCWRSAPPTAIPRCGWPRPPPPSTAT
jgi:hypothetical protein